jgi:hypothetical protein
MIYGTWKTYMLQDTNAIEVTGKILKGVNQIIALYRVQHLQDSSIIQV